MNLHKQQNKFYPINILCYTYNPIAM
uniref:Uncharacterized protein n=1 Tax=Rhizophora mucronata TaxID=61149 RepID=A0A2P2Q8U0_RHIMU